MLLLVIRRRAVSGRDLIDQGYVKEEQLGVDYYRWLYTALTRATERVFLVNFKDEFLA
jgi:exodeoxyribonuclease-5